MALARASSYEVGACTLVDGLHEEFTLCSLLGDHLAAVGGVEEEERYHPLLVLICEDQCPGA